MCFLVCKMFPLPVGGGVFDKTDLRNYNGS